MAVVVDHADRSMCDSTARSGHLDQDFHLEFVVPATQVSFIKFVQSEQPESALAVADFVADERGSLTGCLK